MTNKKKRIKKIDIKERHKRKKERLENKVI